MARTMEWRPLARFPRYELSEHGDLRRIATLKRMRGFIDVDGYLRYLIRDALGVRATCLAHRLVAETFLGTSPGPGYEVAHEDGSRIHNHHSNLRWSLPADNQADKVLHGTSPAGERNPRCKITTSDVVAIRREHRRIKQPGSGRRVAELDVRYGLTRSAIVRIATGQSWPHVPMTLSAEV